MTNAEIQELIKKDETRTLELKKSTGELKDAMHTVCAFLKTSSDCFRFLPYRWISPLFPSLFRASLLTCILRPGSPNPLASVLRRILCDQFPA